MIQISNFDQHRFNDIHGDCLGWNSDIFPISRVFSSWKAGRFPQTPWVTATARFCICYRVKRIQRFRTLKLLQTIGNFTQLFLRPIRSLSMNQIFDWLPLCFERWLGTWGHELPDPLCRHARFQVGVSRPSKNDVRDLECPGGLIVV